MKDDLSKRQIEDILKAMDDMLASGPWEESNFLRVIGKNLSSIRDEFASHVLDQSELANMESHEAKREARSGQQEVFISLYSSEGNKIQSWERIVTNLPKQMISRPVYADENDVKNVIKSKENPVNEAYVAIYILQSDILDLAEDKILKDKFGKKLLSLKDRALNLDNISKFIHLSGSYRYSGGRLLKMA